MPAARERFGRGAKLRYRSLLGLVEPTPRHEALPVEQRLAERFDQRGCLSPRFVLVEGEPKCNEKCSGEFSCRDGGQAKIDVKRVAVSCEKKWAAWWDSTASCVPGPAFLPFTDQLDLSDKVFPVLLALRVQPDGRPLSGAFLHLLRAKLNSDRVLLLLDALDEVPLEEDPRKPQPGYRRDLIERLGRLPRQARVLLTSRIVGYDRAPFALTGSDAELSRAVIRALGHIASPAAAEALAAAKVSDELRGEWTNAYLMCADRMLADGKGASAAGIYRKTFAKGNPTPVRIAALRGIVLAEQAKAAGMLLALMGDENVDVRRAAAKFVIEMPGSVVGM